MAVLRILSRHGDTALEWDFKKVEQGDPEALSAVREAERIFAEHQSRGASAFRIAPDRPAERLERFDPHRTDRDGAASCRRVIKCGSWRERS